MENVIERSFSINLKLMALFSLYRPEKSEKFSKPRAYLKFAFFNVLVPLLIVVCFLVGEEMDATQINYNCMFLADATGFLTKLFPFIRNEGKIRSCINYFAAPRFADFDSEKEAEIVRNCARICRRNTLVLVALLGVTGLGWLVRPVLGLGHNLPVDVYLPFDPKSDIRVFCAVYVFLFIAISYTGFAGCIVDPLIGGLACHAATQLMVLQQKLRNLQSHFGAKNHDVYDKIRKCVALHDEVLSFVIEYEDCFSFAVLSQFVASSFVICFSCLQLTIMPASPAFNLNNTLTSVAGGCIGLAQVYFYCYYGTMLHEEGNNVVTAIYMSNWYDYNNKSKQALLVIMERARKPVIVTAGKVLNLSLNTFTTVIMALINYIPLIFSFQLLKRSYSLLAVLKNYQ